MQGTQFKYAIKFVADMDKAVKFYRDVVGLTLKFESPGWSEFVTGETTLALHPASDKNPAGKVELGFTVADVEAFLPRHERQGRAVHHASKEAGFWRGAGAVCRFGGRSLQRGRGGGVAGITMTDEIVFHHGNTMVRLCPASPFNVPEATGMWGCSRTRCQRLAYLLRAYPKR